jgi:hypothetical protein
MNTCGADLKNICRCHNCDDVNSIENYSCDNFGFELIKEIIPEKHQCFIRKLASYALDNSQGLNFVIIP